MSDIVSLGLLLILGGFVLMVVATLTSQRKGEAQVKGGGVVLIGPIPVVFGSDAKWASVALALAIVLILITLLIRGV